MSVSPTRRMRRGLAKCPLRILHCRQDATMGYRTQKETPSGDAGGRFWGKRDASVTAPLGSAAANHQQHQGEHASNEQCQAAGFWSLHDELLYLTRVGKAGSIRARGAPYVGEDFKISWVDGGVAIAGQSEPISHGFVIGIAIGKGCRLSVWRHEIPQGMLEGDVV